MLVAHKGNAFDGVLSWHDRSVIFVRPRRCDNDEMETTTGGGSEDIHLKLRMHCVTI